MSYPVAENTVLHCSFTVGAHSLGVVTPTRARLRAEISERVGISGRGELGPGQRVCLDPRAAQQRVSRRVSEPVRQHRRDVCAGALAGRQRRRQRRAIDAACAPGPAWRSAFCAAEKGSCNPTPRGSAVACLPVERRYASARTVCGLFFMRRACRPPSFWGLPSVCTQVLGGLSIPCWPQKAAVRLCGSWCCDALLA